MRRFDRSFLEPKTFAPLGERWRKIYADLLGYPVHIDLTIGDGPDAFPCPQPRPAGAPAAEGHTPDDAR